MKQSKYVYNNYYKTIIPKKEVLLVNTESNLKNELTHLENTILMYSKSLNIYLNLSLKRKKNTKISSKSYNMSKFLRRHGYTITIT